MPIIDFKEIPAGNKKGGVDLFETFACRFLERLGYTIEVGPAEGPDGGKDLIVSIDRRDGDGGSRSIRYIVSCKHAAHSGKSIGVSQEKSILDRIIEHKVDGFLAFYSTGLTVPLQTRFREFRNAGREIVEMTGNDIDEIVSDNLFALKDCLVRFFPESVARHMERLRVEDPAQFIEPIIAEFPEVEVVHNSHGRFIGLRSGSEEEEKTFARVTLTFPDDDAARASLRQGSLMNIPRSAIEFDRDTSLGQVAEVMSGTSDTLPFFLFRVPEEVVGDLIFRPSDPHLELVQFEGLDLVLGDKSGGLRIATSNPDSPTSFPFVMTAEETDEGSNKPFNLDFDIVGKRAGVAWKLLQVKDIFVRGGTLELYRADNKERLKLCEIPPTPVSLGNPEGKELCRLLALMERRCGIRCEIPEEGVFRKEFTRLQLLARLLEDGRAPVRVPQLQACLLEEPEEVQVAIETGATCSIAFWDDIQGGACEVMGNSIPIGPLLVYVPEVRVFRSKSDESGDSGQCVRIEPRYPAEGEDSRHPELIAVDHVPAGHIPSELPELGDPQKVVIKLNEAPESHDGE